MVLGVAAVNLLRGGRGLLTIHFPQIADRSHFDILLVLELRSDKSQATAALADADVAQRNSVIRAGNPAV